jgi:hypothetical protein
VTILKPFLAASLCLFFGCKAAEPTPEEILQMGKWQIANVEKIAKNYENGTMNIKDAYMLFADDGTLYTQVMNRKPETGTWRLSDDKEYLHITKDSGLYVVADSLQIYFEDQRTIVLTNQDVPLVFKRQ